MSVQACAELVERGDPDRFFAVMAAPPSAREVMFPLYAFNVEVSRAPWLTQEPMIAEMRLQWWRDALDEIAAGGLVRRHEVVVPLAQVLDAEGARLLDGLIEARRADIDGAAFADNAALLRYVDATAGNLMWCAARQLGSPDAEPVVRKVALASGLARYLRAVPALVAAGRAPLPDGCDVSDLSRSVLAAWPGQPLNRYLPGLSRVALLEAWEARDVLRQAVADPGRVTRGALGQSEILRRASLLKAQMFGL